MISGYEKAYKEMVPAARAALILELKKKYNIREETISRYLGITQAAISKYVNGKYSARIKEIAEKMDRKIIEEYAAMIANGKPEMVNKYLCTICGMLNSFECSFSKIK